MQQICIQIPTLLHMLPLRTRGFDFNSIPDGAIINSFTVKLKARESGVNTSSSYSPRLSNGTSLITSTCSAIGTTATTYSFTGVNTSFETIAEYGNNFGIRINCRRANKSTTGYMYIYGAEIEVNYTVPVQYSVTIANATSVNVTTSDNRPYEGDDVYITAESISNIVITDNNVDVTSQFVQGQSGSISQTAESQTNTGISSGSSYAAYAIGKTAEDPYSSTSNMYSSSGTTGHVDYVFDFSDIPASATISSVTVKANGHAESSTYTSGSRMAEIQLYSGSTAKGSAQHYTSTSNSTITLSDPGTWTWSELQDAKLRFTVANYGGLICGITWTVQYTVSGYVYTITNISTDHAIVVTSSGSGPSFTLKVKQNGSWVSATKVYVKQNGAWVQASKVLVKSGGSWH